MLIRILMIKEYITSQVYSHCQYLKKLAGRRRIRIPGSSAGGLSRKSRMQEKWVIGGLSTHTTEQFKSILAEDVQTF